MKPSVSERARSASLLVAITAHFNAGRLEYLAEVLRSLAEFPVAAMHVVLVTNTVDTEELAVLRRLCDEISPDMRVSIRSYEYLAHPHYLTWRHREIIATEFVEGGYTHFVYLEDDIRLSFANFSYFIEYREILRDAGLLPSFLRVEYSRLLNGFVNTENKSPVDLSEQARIEIGDLVMANIPFPYTASYILDTELATEFVGTLSFKREGSRAVSDWDVRERAAMGLCYENVPAPFQSRYVVPISKTTGTALSCAWISHLPNNYAHDADNGFGKIRMDALFIHAGGSAPHPWAGEIDARARKYVATRQSKRQRLRNVDWYLVFPNKIIEGLRWRLGLRR